MKDLTVIYGIHPIEEALKAGKNFEKIYIARNITKDNLKEIIRLSKENNIPINYVPQEKLNKIVPHKQHQGVAGIISAIEYEHLETLVPLLFEKKGNPVLLILDRVKDVRNIGSIARTAECLGADAIIIPDKETAPINAIAMKASAGAFNFIPVCRTTNLYNVVRALKLYGFKIVACSEKADTLIQNCDFDLPVAIILGSEESGIKTNLLKIADEIVKIDMLGNISSLNVSVACGIVLYEITRQRNEK